MVMRTAMTYVKIRVAGPKAASEVAVVADTGSTFTWIPAEILSKVGVLPASRRRFKTIEGREIERPVAEAKLEVMGESTTTIVVFGEKGDAMVLGAYSLEGLGLLVDPVTKELRKVEAFIAY